MLASLDAGDGGGGALQAWSDVFDDPACGRTVAMIWSPLPSDATMCSASSRHASHCQLVGVTSTGLPAVSFSQPLDRMRRFTTGIPLPVVRYSGSAANRPLMIEMLGSLAKSVSLRFFLVFLVWIFLVCGGWQQHADGEAVHAAEHRLSPALVGPDQQENQTGEREDQARDADDSVAHAYSSNWAMNSSIALRVTRRQLLVPRRLGGRNVVRVPLFAAMSSA